MSNDSAARQETTSSFADLLGFEPLGIVAAIEYEYLPVALDEEFLPFHHQASLGQ